MRIPKMILAVISFIVFGLVIGGCSLFPTNKTRPAPVRPNKISIMRSPQISPSITPRMTPGKRTRPAPVRRPGLGAINERVLADRLTVIDRAALRGNWAVANREVNALGMDMAKFRPAASKGKSLRETASFNAMYIKLQADCKLKNRAMVLRDTRRFKTALSGIKRTA